VSRDDSTGLFALTVPQTTDHYMSHVEWKALKPVPASKSIFHRLVDLSITLNLVHLYFHVIFGYQSSATLST
jgi:hypothetical protein